MPVTGEKAGFVRARSFLYTMDLFDNPVGYRLTFVLLASPAISRPNATLWGCEIAFFSGSCLITEVIKQL
jgi:hypothetical protein